MSTNIIRHTNRFWIADFPHLNPSVPHTTGPLASISNRSVLVIADAQNLMLGARDLGFRLSWKRLGRILDAVSLQVDKHVIYAASTRDARWASYFSRRGWAPHQRISRFVRTRVGFQRRGNTDHHIALISGALLARSTARVIVIASGDGDLVEDIVEASRMADFHRTFVTLSLAGSTNHRLNAAISPFISANIELGRDALRRSFATPSQTRNGGAR